MSSLTTENVLLQQINELAHLTSSKLAPPNTFTAGELRLLLVDAQQKLNALLAAPSPAAETKETTTTTTNPGGEGIVVLVKITPSLALRLSSLKRADLLRRIFSFHKTRNPKEYIHTLTFAPSQNFFTEHFHHHHSGRRFQTPTTRRRCQFQLATTSAPTTTATAAAAREAHQKQDVRNLLPAVGR